MSKYSDNHTPISGPKINHASVEADFNDGMRRHEGRALAWESATDAIHNKDFRHEYKPIMRGPNKH